jgi:disulfide bond formation protein DsbB
MNAMTKLVSRRVANLVGFLACASAYAYALYAQFVLLLDPCPLCLFQRFAIIALGLIFLVAMLHNSQKTGARIYSVLLGIAALIGVVIAGRHIWIQSLPPGSVPSCGAGLSYLFDIMPVFDVIKKVFSGSGECQHVDTLFGISWPWWTAMLMTALGVWGVSMNWSKKSASS